jgi:tetratricopeptide (TPR) repeat protein
MYNDAARYFHTALKNDLKNPNVALDYGLCLIELNDYSAAQKILADAVAQYPDNDDLRIVNAATINYCGDSEKAITELQKLHARMPERTDIMLYLAEAFYDSGEQLDKASNLYRKARKLGASPSPKLEKLGGVDNEEKALLFLYNSAKESEKNGDQLSAIWYYDQILKLEGEKSKIANHLGILQLKNNRPEDVLKNLRNRNNDLNAQILCGIASVMIDKYLDAAAFFRISQRMKINNNNLLINPEVDALARNTVQNMSAKNNADQTIQAALEALNNLLER